MNSSLNTQPPLTPEQLIPACGLGSVYFGGLAIVITLAAASLLTTGLTIATATLGFCVYKCMPRTDLKALTPLLAMAVIALIASATGVIALGWAGSGLTSAIGLGIAATLSAGIVGWCISYLRANNKDSSEISRRTGLRDAFEDGAAISQSTTVSLNEMLDSFQEGAAS